MIINRYDTSKVAQPEQIETPNHDDTDTHVGEILDNTEAHAVVLHRPDGSTITYTEATA